MRCRQLALRGSGTGASPHIQLVDMVARRPHGRVDSRAVDPVLESPALVPVAASPACRGRPVTRVPSVLSSAIFGIASPEMSGPPPLAYLTIPGKGAKPP